MSAAVAMTDPDLDQFEADLVAYMAELRDLPASVRHGALVEWVRGPLWHSCHLLLTGWQGDIAREAWRSMRRDLEADTPGNRWERLPAATGRTSIIRLLGLEDTPPALYAALAFKTWTDDDDRTWIAGAVGCPPMLTGSIDIWAHLDIRDVILWDPRTDEARLVGEHASVATFVMPDLPDPRLTVWGSCGAFFRAWAARRARLGWLAQERAAGRWVHPITEARDGDLPGALLIGDIARARWPSPACTSVIAGQGLTAGELHACAVRSAHLPAFGGGAA